MEKWLLVSVLVLGSLLILASGGMTSAQVSEPPDRVAQTQADVSIAAVVNSRISYQGMLKENGQPVTGSRDMLFRLYSNDTCTTQVGSDIVQNGVQVADGLFSVKLPVTQGDFNGQGLWLRVRVGPTTWIGCQEILPVPYALSLRPGATVRGAPGLAGSLVSASTEGGEVGGSLVQGLVLTAAGVYGSNSLSSGFGVFGIASGSNGSGVYGRSSSANGYGIHGENSAGGYAGYFEGDVAQRRTDDGLVKAAAMVYCGQLGSTINYSFNNIGSSIAVSNGIAAGRCTIDFNFDLTNRYWSVTSAGTSTVPTGVSCQALVSPNDTMQCVRWLDNGTGTDGLIMVVVY